MTGYMEGFNAAIAPVMLTRQMIAEGEEKKRRNSLAQLAGQYYANPSPNGLAAIAQVDPQAAGQMAGYGMQQQQFQAQQEAREREMASQQAKLLAALPGPMRAQAWPQVKARLQASGIDAPWLPDEYTPELDQFVLHLAGGKDDTPSDIRSLQILQQNPDLLALDLQRKRAGYEAMYGTQAQFRDPPQPSAIQDRIAQARAMGATPEQIRNMVLGDAAPKPPKAPTAAQLSSINKAKAKISALTALENQLANVEQAFQGIKGSASAGYFGQGLLPTEKGRSFDRSVALLSPLIRQLTRVPGEGAMSDYESRLAQAALPTRSEYESVTEQQIAELRQLIETTKNGYGELLTVTTADSGAEQPQASGGPAVGTVEDGYRFNGGDPADPKSWTKVQ